MTDDEILHTNAHISTDTILGDIAETEAEISTMEREADHLEQAPNSLQSARLDHMRASVRRSGIVEREAFISKLRHLLELRGQVAK